MLKPTGKQKQITARFLSPGAEVDSLFGESLWEPGLTGEFGMQDAILPYNLMVIYFIYINMCRYKLLNWMLGSALASVMLSKLHSSRTSVAVAALATEAV